MSNDGMMTINDYKEIYEKICYIAGDADSFGLFKHISDEDVEKCKWIYLINEVLEDVPMGRVIHTFHEKKIELDIEKFLEENDM